LTFYVHFPRKRAKVANECLEERTGDEGRAIWESNAVIARQAKVRS